MSQLQTQKLAALNTQSKLKFCQRIKEKENTNELKSLEYLFEHFSKFIQLHSDVDDDIDDNEEYDQFQVSTLNFENDPLVENTQFNLDNLGMFCYKYLSNCTLDQLILKQIFTHLSIFINKNLKKLLNSHLSNESLLNFESTINNYFICIETLVDFITQSLSQTTAKIEIFSKFFLAIIEFMWSYLKYLKFYKNLDPSEYNESQQELNIIINSILIKISLLIETKLNDLTDVKNELNLLKLCKFFLNIIDYFKESKCVVVLWKVLAKLICKNKLLLSQQTDSNKRKKLSIIRKMFEILYDRIYVNVKCIKLALIKQDSSTSSCFNLSNTQLNFTNNLIQDSAKMIKISSFLFKHFKSISMHYYSELNFSLNESFFTMIINLCSLINSVFLFEHQTNIDTCYDDQSIKSQSINYYQTIKTEFVKEFSLTFESLVQVFENVNGGANDMLKYLASRNDLTESAEKLTSDEHYLEEILLFYCVLINRNNTINFIHTTCTDPTPFLNNILDMLEVCSCSIYLPSYLLKYDEFLSECDFNKYQSFNCKHSQKIEFYNFVLCTLNNFLLKILNKNKLINEYIYLLSNNMLDVNTKHFKCRLKASYELLLSIGLRNKTVDFLVFISNLYEISKIPNPYLKYLLIELVDDYNEYNGGLVKKFETYLVEHNSFRSYSLLSKYFVDSNYLTAFCMNIVQKAQSLYINLIELIKSLSKTKTSEQIWIRKIIAFIETNNPNNEILNILINLETIYEEKMQEACENLLQKILQFIQLSELDNLVKYFEAARSIQDEDSSIRSQTVQKLNSSTECLNKIYLFVTDSINIYKFLFMKKISCKDVLEPSLTIQLMPMLIFLYKHCSIDLNESINLTVNKSLNLIISNIKLHASHLIRAILADKEIKEQSLHAKLYELFCTLLNDSNLAVKFFTLECFNELSMTNQTSNKIIRDLTRSDLECKEFFLRFIKKIPFNSSLTDYDMLTNRSNEHLCSLKDYFQKGQSENNSINLENPESQFQSLDDTMNALMSTTMDITCSNNNDENSDENNHQSDKIRTDAQLLISNINTNIEKLQDLCGRSMNSNTKVWLKEEITMIYQKVKDLN